MLCHKLRQMLTAQGAVIQRHDQQLSTVAQGLQEVSVRHGQILEDIREQMRLLSTPLHTDTPTSSPPVPGLSTGSPPHLMPAVEPRLPPPECFSGDSDSCRLFIMQCSLVFELQPTCFPSEKSQVAYIISLLTRRARDWGTAEWEKQTRTCLLVQLFLAELQKVFDHSSVGRKAAHGLLTLRQGRRRVVDYSIEFRTMAAENKWNSFSLFDAYYNALSDGIKDELASRDLSADLDSLVALSIRIDNQLGDRKQ
ncbi:hypothetical protein LDENG_00079030 [Lucifuga dentata]|nr:hypothetical protein LDENG_00079030 [Lucifuga dentata]